MSELSRDAQPASHQELRNSLDAVFESDDKLLTSLQKLGWELDQPDPDAAQPVEKLRETCLRYSITTEQSPGVTSVLTADVSGPD